MADRRPVATYRRHTLSKTRFKRSIIAPPVVEYIIGNKDWLPVRGGHCKRNSFGLKASGRPVPYAVVI